MTDINIDGLVPWLKNWFYDKTELSSVATTGSYNDLTDKPNIPTGSIVDTALDISSNNAIANSTVTNALNGKSDTGHSHNYASSSHTHGTWDSITITNGTLYYNSAIRMCALRYSRTFSSASANTMYEWGQLIPSTYRPKYMVSGSGNRNGATITIDSDGYVYGRFAIAFTSSTSFYYHVMWHY